MATYVTEQATTTINPRDISSCARAGQSNMPSPMFNKITNATTFTGPRNSFKTSSS